MSEMEVLKVDEKELALRKNVEFIRAQKSVWLDSLDRADDTKAAYGYSLDKFITWLEENAPGGLSGNIVRKWRDSIDGSASTANLRLSAVRSFFTWAREQLLIEFNPTDGVRGRRRRGTNKHHKRDELTGAEIEAVLATCDLETVQGKRDYAIVSLMAYTGLRTIEVHRANVADLGTKNGRAILWVQGKGYVSKDDFAILPELAERAILAWLSVRKSEDESLFISLSKRSKGKRLSRVAIRKMILARYREAGVAGAGDTKSTHSLRHSAINGAIRGGASLEEAQGMARHESLTTTQIYFNQIDRFANPAEDRISYG